MTTFMFIALPLHVLPVVRCDMPADVVFLMDASGSIKPGEWQQEKEFVANLIDSLAVGPRAIHVGVIVYSTDIGQVIDLQPFKSRTQLKAMLRGLEQDGQGELTSFEVQERTYSRKIKQKYLDIAQKVSLPVSAPASCCRHRHSSSCRSDEVHGGKPGPAWRHTHRRRYH